MARKGKVSFGKVFKKKTSKGKFKRGTRVCYKYINGRRVSTVKAKGRSK